MTGPAALPALDLLEKVRMDEMRGRVRKVSGGMLLTGGVSGLW